MKGARAREVETSEKQAGLRFRSPAGVRHRTAPYLKTLRFVFLVAEYVVFNHFYFDARAASWLWALRTTAATT